MKNLGVLISESVLLLSLHSLASRVCRGLKLFVNDSTVSEDFILAAF